jgi:hypothetical protein
MVIFENYLGSWPILMIGFGPVSPPRSDTSGGDVGGLEQRPGRGVDQPSENTEYQMYGCAGITLLGHGFPLAA